MIKQYTDKGVPLYSAKEIASKRYGEGLLMTPFGHIFSVLVEELNLTQPNVKKMIKEINKCISIGGNGFAQVHSFSNEVCYGCKVHYGIDRYISHKKISKKRKEQIKQRIDDELRGITLEDRAFEGLPETLRLY